jgi:hypothetical protein
MFPSLIRPSENKNPAFQQDVFLLAEKEGLPAVIPGGGCFKGIKSFPLCGIFVLSHTACSGKPGSLYS